MIRTQGDDKIACVFHAGIKIDDNVVFAKDVTVLVEELLELAAPTSARPADVYQNVFAIVVCNLQRLVEQLAGVLL